MEKAIKILKKLSYKINSSDYHYLLDLLKEKEELIKDLKRKNASLRKGMSRLVIENEELEELVYGEDEYDVEADKADEYIKQQKEGWFDD